MENGASAFMITDLTNESAVTRRFFAAPRLEFGLQMAVLVRKSVSPGRVLSASIDVNERGIKAEPAAKLILLAHLVGEAKGFA